ncbi:MAG: flavin reductase [Halobacteriales archaeon]
MVETAPDRVELPEPGPMLPPVSAVVLGVKGDDRTPDDLSVCWTFVVEGEPPQVGVTVTEGETPGETPQVALGFLEDHGEFTLNVPEARWVEAFDEIDRCADERADKFERTGLTRLPSARIDAPGIQKAPIVLECSVIESYSLPPTRRSFHADVVRTTAQTGVTDEDGRLNAEAQPIFGMTAGSGEFWTLGEKVGHIDMTAGIDHIRY